MRANEAPEKLYVELCSDGVYAHVREWENSDNIEYTRTDAFIEKACEWLKNSSYGYLTENWGETELDRETLAEDFRKYMKGE